MKDHAVEMAKNWTQNDYFDQVDRDEIINLLETQNENEIIDRFHKDLEFGTGGLRSIIGVGSNRINKYNVRKATHAMALVAKRNKKDKFTACISYDCRNFSKDFALEAAKVFCGHGFTTHIFKELNPTPLLSFAVRHFDADCGIMITASHNPKEYNGFKAYWSDGAQVTPPYDEEVIKQYKDINNWNEIPLMDTNESENKNLLQWIEDDFFEEYYSKIENECVAKETCQSKGDQLKVIYSSLHGTGLVPCHTISNRLGFTNFQAIESQAIFDGSFSNISTTPNPEDPEALKLAVAQMLEDNADLAYATDPDCDRLGVVANDRGTPNYLNGNQIALLMLDYRLKTLKEKKEITTGAYILKSIVTSPLQETIANKFKVKTYDTLTGFKWMAMKLKEIEDSTNDQFIFASEESFGYMPYDFVRDKDAVASIALMNELALHHKLNKKNLVQALDEIYEEYGFAQESLISLTFPGLEGAEKINKIMNHFRKNISNSIGDFKVKTKNDFLSLQKLDLLDGSKSEIHMHKSNVLGFEFTQNTTLYLRPSGTEPKIKFYCMVQVDKGTLKEKKLSAQTILTNLENTIQRILEEI